MLPLPGIISRAVSAPMRLVLRKERPENGRDLIITLVVYLTIWVLLSLPFVLLNWPPHLGWSDWPPYWHFIPGAR